MTSIVEIEREALELPHQERAILAYHLLQSLPDESSDGDEGLLEAQRREEELRINPSIGLSLNEFDTRIQSR